VNFGEFSFRNCLENSWKASRPCVFGPKRRPSECSSPPPGGPRGPDSGLIPIFQTVSPRTPVYSDRRGPYRRLLSLLVSNLSRIRSKAPVPMRAPPEKGCSRAPMVNKTSPITAARVTTIRRCAHVFSSPKR
jgi:hypothetical protein